MIKSKKSMPFSPHELNLISNQRSETLSKEESFSRMSSSLKVLQILLVLATLVDCEGLPQGFDIEFHGNNGGSAWRRRVTPSSRSQSQLSRSHSGGFDRNEEENPERWSGVLSRPRLDNRPLTTISNRYDQLLRPRGRCDRRIRVVNGATRIRDKGTLVRFQCAYGFHMLGASVAVCVRGRWSDPPPICVRDGCGKLPIPIHGTLRLLYGGGVGLFTCLYGYSIEGERVLTCDGHRWNGTAPSCVELPPVTLTPTTVPTTTISPVDLDTSPTTTRVTTEKPSTSTMAEESQAPIVTEFRQPTSTEPITLTMPVSSEEFLDGRQYTEDTTTHNSETDPVTTEADSVDSTDAELAISDGSTLDESTLGAMESTTNFIQEASIHPSTESSTKGNAVKISVSTRSPIESETTPPNFDVSTKSDEEKTRTRPTAEPTVNPVTSTTATIPTTTPQTTTLSTTTGSTTIPSTTKMQLTTTVTTSVPPTTMATTTIQPSTTTTAKPTPTTAMATTLRSTETSKMSQSTVKYHVTTISFPNVERPTEPTDSPDLEFPLVIDSGDKVGVHVAGSSSKLNVEDTSDQLGVHHLIVVVGTVLVVFGLLSMVGGLLMYCWRKNKGIARPRSSDMDGRTLSFHEGAEELVWSDNTRL